MPLWRIAPIKEEPSSTLTSWSVFETESKEWHLCGYATECREGRVTSAVQSFDIAKAIAMTTSGRVYKLKGRPGANSDAEYVKANWLSLNKVADHRDVTSEVWASMEAHRTGGAARR